MRLARKFVMLEVKNRFLKFWKNSKVHRNLSRSNPEIILVGASEWFRVVSKFHLETFLLWHCDFNHSSSQKKFSPCLDSGQLYKLSRRKPGWRFTAGYKFQIGNWSLHSLQASRRLETRLTVYLQLTERRKLSGEFQPGGNEFCKSKMRLAGKFGHVRTWEKSKIFKKSESSENWSPRTILKHFRGGSECFWVMGKLDSEGFSAVVLTIAQLLVRKRVLTLYLNLSQLYKLPGGNQVDGLPPAAQLWKISRSAFGDSWFSLLLTRAPVFNNFLELVSAQTSSTSKSKMR